ncbi:hypothetical protein ACQCN2_03570 [Brevibacillus ginsengisoli]|uniref:hypothetical protein n=1 Tax=Brevibacillus ginsengisoli TaxID=363854 RepID=UPI003CF7EC5B
MKYVISAITGLFEEYIDADEADYVNPPNLELTQELYSPELIMNHVKNHLKRENHLINFFYQLSVLDKDGNRVNFEALSYHNDLTLLSRTIHNPITEEIVSEYQYPMN